MEITRIEGKTKCKCAWCGGELYFSAYYYNGKPCSDIRCSKCFANAPDMPEDVKVVGLTECVEERLNHIMLMEVTRRDESAS